jgi:hypothetical protein
MCSNLQTCVRILFSGLSSEVLPKIEKFIAAGMLIVFAGVIFGNKR